jgi:hypothetical protein
MNQNAKAEIIRALTDAYGPAKAESLLAQMGLDRRTELAAQIFSAWVSGFSASSGPSLKTLVMMQQIPEEVNTAFKMANAILEQAHK